jgi:hypothetical protein
MDKPLVTANGDWADEDERPVAIELIPSLDMHRSKLPGGTQTSVNPSWRTVGRLATGTGEDGRCSISFSSPRHLGQLPISISTAVHVRDIKVGLPWGEDPAIPNSVPGVYDRIADYPTFFETVVLGFLDDISLHGTPGHRGGEGWDPRCGRGHPPRGCRADRGRG